MVVWQIKKNYSSVRRLAGVLGSPKYICTSFARSDVTAKNASKFSDVFLHSKALRPVDANNENLCRAVSHVAMRRKLLYNAALHKINCL
jgi:hypothetical protein